MPLGRQKSRFVHPEIGPVLLAADWDDVSAADLAQFLARLDDAVESPAHIHGLESRIDDGPTRGA